MYSIMNITTLYVSQEYGNDRNRGFSANTEENGTGPLKTIEKALEIVSQNSFWEKTDIENLTKISF